jgi:hypothetical protein
MIRLDNERERMNTVLQDNLGLQHIRLELARLDGLIMQLVYRWQRAGKYPLEAFRGSISLMMKSEAC